MFFYNLIGKSALLLLSCQMVILLVAGPVAANEPDTGNGNETKEQLSSGSEEPEWTPAVAVYYAKRYHGRRTHSGEKFDNTKLTAAHPSLPHGTRVKIVNIANDRSVVVTINDRCRERSFELIDLSRAAARELGFLGKGAAKVRIIPLTDDL
jgi:rare lipoprotein A